MLKWVPLHLLFPSPIRVSAMCNNPVVILSDKKEVMKLPIVHETVGIRFEAQHLDIAPYLEEAVHLRNDQVPDPNYSLRNMQH